MKTYVLTILLFLNSNFLFAQGVAVVSSFMDNTWQLFELNPLDCSLEFITNIEKLLFDITYHPNGGLYGIQSDGSLWEIDITTGDCTLVYTIGPSSNLQTFNSLVTSPNGTVYATGDLGELYTYNISSGVEMFLGIIPFTASGDLIFFNNKLYLAATDVNDYIIQVNLSNPANSFELISSFLDGNIYGILSYSENCADVKSYALEVELNGNTTSVYEINYGNNTLNYICEFDGPITGGASTFDFFGSVSVSIQDFEVSAPTSCTQSDGTITVQAFGGTGQLTYSIIDNVFETNNQFTGLSSGTYGITVTDENGCQDVGEADLNLLDFPILTDIEITPVSCLGAEGIIEVIGSGGTGALTYSIDGINFQDTGLFDSLLLGNYTITVQDENFCNSAEIIEVGFPPIPVIDTILLEPIFCDNELVSFAMEVSNFTGELEVILNDTIFQNHLTFDNLPNGTYQISIADDLGCEADTTIVLARKYCSIYIPNAFSANGDGYNDDFKIYPHPKFEGKILSVHIFDRWGNTLYGNKDFDFEIDSWDGTFNGKVLNAGVFVYVIKVDYGDGIREVLSGDISLVK